MGFNLIHQTYLYEVYIPNCDKLQGVLCILLLILPIFDAKD